MNRKFLIIYIIIPSILLAAPVKTDHVELELISEVQSIQPGKSFWIGVLFNLADDWHIYWQNPGDAGMAPKFRWILPSHFKVGKIQWPYPERSITVGIASFVYSHQVLLMAKVTPPKQLTEGGQISLQVQVSWLECKDICLPGKAELQLRLPVRYEKPRKNVAWQNIFKRTTAKIPRNNSDWLIKAVLADSTVLLALETLPLKDFDIKSMEFFPYNSTDFNNAAGQNSSMTTEGYFLKLFLAPTLLKIPEKLTGILVIDRGDNKKEALIIDLPLGD